MRHSHTLALLMLLSLLLLAPQAGAQSSSCLTTLSLSSSDIANSLGNAVSVSFIAILFSFSIVALSYVLGEVLKVEGLKKWYQGELWETVKSILIVISIFSILVISSGIATAIGGYPASFSLSGNQQSLSTSIWANLEYFYYSTYCDYIYPMNTSMNNDFDYVYGLALGTDFMKSLTLDLYIPIPIPIPIPGIFAGFTFGSESNIYVSSIIDTASKSTSFLADFTTVVVVPLYLLFAMQMQYFYTIVILGLTFFIPFGVILRAIPVVRPIGGTLLAIGIGISLVYPALFVAMNIPLTTVANSIFVAPQSSSTPFSGLLSILSGVASTILNFYSNTSIITGFGAGLSGVLGVYDQLNFITYTMVNALVQFLLLIFDLVIGLVVTGHIATLLGGRLPTGLGKKFKIA
jgi:hypothetical protein